MSNSHKCMGINGEALQLHSVYKKPYILLQVTQEFVSGYEGVCVGGGSGGGGCEGVENSHCDHADIQINNLGRS